MSEKLRLTVLRFALIFGLITLCFIGGFFLTVKEHIVKMASV